MAEVNCHLDISVGAASAYLASIVQSNIKMLKNYFLIRYIPNQPYFHFVMTGKNAWLGQTRLLMKEAGNKILAVLT